MDNLLDEDWDMIDILTTCEDDEISEACMLRAMCKNEEFGE